MGERNGNGSQVQGGREWSKEGRLRKEKKKKENIREDGERRTLQSSCRTGRKEHTSTKKKKKKTETNNVD